MSVSVLKLIHNYFHLDKKKTKAMQPSTSSSSGGLLNYRPVPGAPVAATQPVVGLQMPQLSELLFSKITLRLRVRYAVIVEIIKTAGIFQVQHHSPI